MKYFIFDEFSFLFLVLVCYMILGVTDRFSVLSHMHQMSGNYCILILFYHYRIVRFRYRYSNRFVSFSVFLFMLLEPLLRKAIIIRQNFQKAEKLIRPKPH